LAEIEDPRRAEGKLYRLPHVVLFAILARFSKQPVKLALSTMP
jgi:hypothetical protein